jgi:phage shock protein C
MTRSFTNRVLAGICGGIGATLRLNPWLVRFIWVGLSVASFGFGTLVYLALWWALPQGTMVRPPRGGVLYLLLTLIIMGVMSALWIGRDMIWLQTGAGQSLFLPLVLLMLSVVFLIRQVR